MDRLRQPAPSLRLMLKLGKEDEVLHNMSPQARIEALQKAPLDGWAAFSENEDSIVAYGATYDEVVAAAAERGVSDPVVVKIPENWHDRVLGN